MQVVMGDDRAPHWIKQNQQCRIPKRWIAFDTESTSERDDSESVQRWASGACITWQRGLKSGDRRTDYTFETPERLWEVVRSHCRPGTRTVAVAHNLGFDIRISRCLEILPTLGFELEWCNLDRNVSTMTWRSEYGTLVLCDLFTWLPMPLQEIGNLVGCSKLPMPNSRATNAAWNRYCLRDTEIVYLAKSSLLDWIASEQLGNWQPTGAGMSYGTWRHKFMSHKVLVHDNAAVIAHERMSMHTGRAEAWRHGVLSGDTWHEVDMRTAYTRIAAECELPQKYKFSTGPITQSQYEQLTEIYRVNCLVDVSAVEPIAPVYHDGHTLWPVGQYRTTLWDVEVNELLSSGQGVTIRSADVYTKATILGDWARWILTVQGDTSGDTPLVVKAFAKHCGRALIGRFSLRAPKWEEYGDNPMGEVGLSYQVDHKSGQVQRMMHVGAKTYIETHRVEGRDSLPQITGWVMAKCRMLLWEAMRIAGTSEIAHVDTDSVLVTARALALLREVYAADFNELWKVKGTWQSLDVYGPRNLRTGRQRKMSGVPVKAVETERDSFSGEVWSSLAADMANGRAGAVTVTDAVWTVQRKDPRRLSVDGGSTHTRPVCLPLD
jgi:hypothetical protein